MAHRQQRSRGSVVAAGVLVVVAVGGLILPRLVATRSTGDRRATAVQPATATGVAGSTSDAAQASPVTVAAPSSATFGVPVGYPQSSAGVRAAAVAWVSSLGEVLQMGPIGRDELLAAVLSRRALAETVEEFRAERDRFNTEFGRDLSQAVWRDAPLTVRITVAESTRAVVEVWSVLLYGTTTDRIEMLWRTHTITLVWERESWRVDDVARRDGPTPVLADVAMPSTGTEFDPVIDATPAVLAGTSVG